MWKWIALGAFVLWYLTKREEKARPITSANRAASGAVDSAGRAVSKIIDEAGPAIGKWLGGLFSGSGNNSTTTSSSAATSDTSDYGWSDGFS